MSIAANTFAQRGLPDQAEACYRRALEFDPTYAMRGTILLIH
jgi:hypothetical protein